MLKYKIPQIVTLIRFFGLPQYDQFFLKGG